LHKVTEIKIEKATNGYIVETTVIKDGKKGELGSNFPQKEIASVAMNDSQVIAQVRKLLKQMTAEEEDSKE